MYGDPRYGDWWASPDGIRRDRDRVRRSLAVIAEHPAWFAGTAAPPGGADVRLRGRGCAAGGFAGHRRRRAARHAPRAGAGAARRRTSTAATCSRSCVRGSRAGTPCARAVPSAWLRPLLRPVQEALAALALPLVLVGLAALLDRRAAARALRRWSCRSTRSPSSRSCTSSSATSCPMHACLLVLAGTALALRSWRLESADTRSGAGSPSRPDGYDGGDEPHRFAPPPCPPSRPIPGLVHGFEQRLGPAGWEDRDETRRRVAQALAGAGPPPAPQAGARLPRAGRALGGPAGSGRRRRGRAGPDPRDRDRRLPARPPRGSGPAAGRRRPRRLARHGGGRDPRERSRRWSRAGRGRATSSPRSARRSAPAATRSGRSCRTRSVPTAAASSGPGRAASPTSTSAPPTSGSSSRPGSRAGADPPRGRLHDVPRRPVSLVSARRAKARGG